MCQLNNGHKAEILRSFLEYWILNDTFKKKITKKCKYFVSAKPKFNINFCGHGSTGEYRGTRVLNAYSQNEWPEELVCNALLSEGNFYRTFIRYWGDYDFTARIYSIKVGSILTLICCKVDKN